MATLYIIEYAETASANFGREAAAPKAPPIAKQAIAITGASVPLFTLALALSCAVMWGEGNAVKRGKYGL